MFQNIQNIIQRYNDRLKPHLSCRGQASVVLILVIAIALIIYSISLNWGRIAQYKTMTTIASNTAASQMASMLASYGEQQLQVALGGRIEYCKRTNFLVLLVTFIIAVVIAYFTGPQNGVYFWLAVTGAVLAGLALVIHVTVVEPGLTRLWNRMQANLPLDGQIIESAIMTGVQSVVSDSSRISDHFDMDADGLWVNSADAGNVAARKDKINRFAFYYTKRLQSFTPDSFPEIQEFIGGLNELLYDNPTGSATPDNFGIFDPGCTGTSPSPYCNPCCLPQFEPDGVTPLRPENCTATQIALCGISGDYPVSAYTYQYEPSRENFDNAFLSFRERLGIDDENVYFNRNPLNPNSPPPQTLAVDPNKQFRIEDTTGFYTALDKRKGVFPFFWTMDALQPAIPVLAVPPPVIPLIPKSDNVTEMTNFVTPADQCSSDVGFDVGTMRPRSDGFYWKFGSDEYCSDVYPYNDCISRVGNCADGDFTGTLPSCGCEASDDPTLWHDDSQDNLVAGLKEFSLWAQDQIQTDIAVLNRDFASWYPKAAFWIAPRCPAAANCSNPVPTDPVTCRYCNNETNDGLLMMWRDMLGAWVDLIDNWLYKTSFEDATAYCMPAIGNFIWAERSYMPSQQTGTPIPQDRLGVNMPPFWGDLNDTIACLEYNQNNYQKIQTCQTACLRDCRPPAVCDHNGNADACLNLPRSVFNIYANNGAQYTLAQQYQDCLSSTCSDSFGVTLPVCSWIAGANCAGWPGNAFNANVRTLRNAAIDASDICEPGPTSASTSFQDMIVLAKAEAWAQQPHLRDRLPILINLRSAALPARATFLDGYNNLSAFLKPCAAGLQLGDGCNNCAAGGPAAKLICARRGFDPDAAANQLANFVIYGWQSKPVSGRGPLGTDPDKGYWHLVRVEAFAPQRCYGQCGTDRLPWVKTWTSGGFFNRKRCYGLKDTTGTVIARVTRYDEDRDSPGARFVNNQLIWKFRFTNPGVASVATPGNVLSTDCMHPPAYDVGVSPATKVELDSAFMINKLGDVNASCWNTVNALLNRGVQTTTCARYEYDPAINHMSLKFTTCDQGAVGAATTCAATGTCT